MNYGVHVATPSYKITKAALNMLTAQYALQYGDEGFAVTAISPGVSLYQPIRSSIRTPIPPLVFWHYIPNFGEETVLGRNVFLLTEIVRLSQWIKTNLGTDYADLTMDQALPAIVDLVLRINKEHNGKFLDVKVPGWEHKYSGSGIPW